MTGFLLFLGGLVLGYAIRVLHERLSKPLPGPEVEPERFEDTGL